jgi:hypothetical protein
VKIIMASRPVLEEVVRRVSALAPACSEGRVFLRIMGELLHVHHADKWGGAHDVPVRTNWKYVRGAAQEFGNALRSAGGPENLLGAKELSDFIAYGDLKPAYE